MFAKLYVNLHMIKFTTVFGCRVMLSSITTRLKQRINHHAHITLRWYWQSGGVGHNLTLRAVCRLPDGDCIVLVKMSEVGLCRRLNSSAA
jgi:hypothetical protein